MCISYLRVAAACLVAVTTFICTLLFIENKDLKEQAERQRTNTETLLADVSRYKVSDSLNAAKVGLLELKIGQYERFRAQDAQAIRELAGKNRDLAGVAASKTESAHNLRVVIRDSIVIRDTVERVLPCIDYRSKWVDLSGCVDNGTFDGVVTCRDCLLIVESVRYKRFLWWKTKKVKDRDFRILSRNPDTKILGFEVVSIEK